MKLEEFVKLIAESGRKNETVLKNDYADLVRDQVSSDCMEKLLSTRKNVIFLETKESPEDDIPVGTSKIGGYPDLPPSISVPEFGGYTQISDGERTHHDRCSMRLAAQINLAEFTAYDTDKKLPEKGMLYFFWSGEDDYIDYLRESGDLIFDGGDTAIHKVIYYDGDLSLLKRTKPELPYSEVSEPFDVCRIIPKFNTYMYDNYNDSLWSIFYKEFRSEETASKLAHAYYPWDECNKDRVLGYFNGSMNVTPGKNLLFQYGYHSGSIWDIYWFIEDEDLAERKFENSYMRFDVD